MPVRPHGGQGARQQPTPALVRIKHDALLPNRFRADVRECDERFDAT